MNPIHSKPSDPTPGYTLLEAMISVLIVGLLASIAAPSFREARNDARNAEAEIALQLISGAVEQLTWDTAKWPGGEDVSYNPVTGNEVENLNATNAGLVVYGNQFDGTDWKGPYISIIEPDPWGMNYFVDVDYELVDEGDALATVSGSYGVNKLQKNNYDDDNIIDIIKRY